VEKRKWNGGFILRKERKKGGKLESLGTEQKSDKTEIERKKKDLGK